MLPNRPSVRRRDDRARMAGLATVLGGRLRSTLTELAAIAHNYLIELVRVKGLEPPLPYGKQILSLPRLPFRHTRIR